MGLFDEVNKRYRARKEGEKKEREIELQRRHKLENAERKLVQDFNNYLPKMSNDLHDLGFSVKIDQFDLNPGLEVFNINTKERASVKYSKSDSNEDKGTIRVSFNSSNNQSAEEIEYYIDEEEKVKMSDGSTFNLEDEVVRHYEELLNRL